MKICFDLQSCFRGEDVLNYGRTTTARLCGYTISSLGKPAAKVSLFVSDHYIFSTLYDQLICEKSSWRFCLFRYSPICLRHKQRFERF